jgi:dephospho-CoA kinase
LLLGVTGNIACGKSSVMAMLGELGARIIDADAVYGDLVQPGMPLLAAIGRAFGDAVIRADGALDRPALAAIVFSDPAALAKLDDLVRPVVGPEVLRRAARTREAVVAIDAVKLFESGLAAACDETWAVTCPPEAQVERLMKRNGFDRAEAMRRIAAQAPQEDKVARADVVIDNAAAPADTERQVRAAFDAFLRRHRTPRAAREVRAS